MFSNKSKVADAKWKIETFKQEKKYIADFMIEFEALAMKAEIDKLYAIFLLKKNVQANIIKTILGYLLIAVPKILEEWKVVITSIRQEYEFTEKQQDYRTVLGMIYKIWDIHIDIGKAKDNFDKDRKPKCFNCNVYRHMAKDYKKSKKK